MALRLTPEQALKMGILSESKRTSGKLSKREKIKAYLLKIQSAQCKVTPLNNGALVEIEGLGVPSLNAMLDWDQKTEAYSYKKEWHKLIHYGALESNIKRTFKCINKPCELKIVAYHTRLLDLDNICPKYLIDGIVRAGIIQDDDPRYVAGYSVKQHKAKGRVPSIIVKLEYENETHK